MRIAWETRFRMAEAGIQRLQQQIATAQQQVATGSRLNSLADDPVAFGRAQRLQELLDTTDRRLRLLQAISEETRTVQTQTEALSTALQDIFTLLSEALDPKHLDKPAIIGEQLRQRIDDVLSLANSHDNGHYLFAGTQTVFSDGEGAFRLQAGTPTPDNPSGLQVLFRGNLAERRVEVFPGQEEVLSLRADELFGADGTELFRVLIAAYNLLAYRADGTRRPPEEPLSDAERAQVEALLPQIAAFQARVDQATARAGARQQRWDLLQEQLQALTTQLRAARSAVTDADLVEVALDLQRAQTVLQAVLQTTTRVLGMNLFDFLR